MALLALSYLCPPSVSPRGRAPSQDVPSLLFPLCLHLFWELPSPSVSRLRGPLRGQGKQLCSEVMAVRSLSSRQRPCLFFFFFFKGSDSGRKDKGSFKLFLGWEAMSLCGQHSLGVHYNCIFQSSPTGFIIGGNMPLYSPSPDSGNQLSRLVHGDISVFSVYLGFNWYLEERTINGGCQMVTI